MAAVLEWLAAIGLLTTGGATIALSIVALMLSRDVTKANAACNAAEEALRATIIDRDNKALENEKLRGAAANTLVTIAELDALAKRQRAAREQAERNYVELLKSLGSADAKTAVEIINRELRAISTDVPVKTP